MSDSSELDDLEAKHERIRERRIEGIKRWAEYVKSNPPEKWGPQQNAVVNGQLEAAQSVEMSASDRQRISDLAAEILKEREESDRESK